MPYYLHVINIQYILYFSKFIFEICVLSPNRGPLWTLGSRETADHIILIDTLGLCTKIIASIVFDRSSQYLGISTLTPY